MVNVTVVTRLVTRLIFTRILPLLYRYMFAYITFVIYQLLFEIDVVGGTWAGWFGCVLYRPHDMMARVILNGPAALKLRYAIDLPVGSLSRLHFLGVKWRTRSSSAPLRDTRSMLLLLPRLGPDVTRENVLRMWV